MHFCQMKIYGLRAIIEAVDSGENLERIYRHRQDDSILMQELMRAANKNNVPVQVVPEAKLERLSRDNNHQGAIAVTSAIDYASLTEILEVQVHEARCFLLLDGVTDVRNYGAILRSAEAAGVTAVVVPERGGAQLNADAIKTSAGAAYHLNICREKHIKDAIYLLQSYGIPIYGANEKSHCRIYDLDLSQDIAIIMGSEERGISSGVQKILTSDFSLPMQGEIGSLNVSVAAGVSLFEMVRQRQLKI